jgi:hypothetical protein
VQWLMEFSKKTRFIVPVPNLPPKMIKPTIELLYLIFQYLGAKGVNNVKERLYGYQLRNRLTVNDWEMIEGWSNAPMEIILNSPFVKTLLNLPVDQTISLEIRKKKEVF